MWLSKKKKKTNPQIKIHELEIEKLKLQDQLKAQSSQGVTCSIIFVVFLLTVSLLWLG